MNSTRFGRRPLLLSLLPLAPVGCASPPSPVPPVAREQPPPFQSHVFDVRRFGADATGREDSTAAIQRAIDAASSAGGGTLWFAAGTYATGPLRLRSNLTLHLDAGSVLSFSPRFEDYLPMVRCRWEGTLVKTFSPLLYATEAHGIRIEGSGTLLGNGAPWWDFFEQLREGKRTSGAWDTSSRWQQEFFRENPNLELPDDPDRLSMGFLRPPFLQFLDCHDVAIRGVTFRDSPFWTLNPVFCQNLTFEGLTIENPEHAANTDGINPESCRDVRILGCHIDVGDDCITIKSGRDAQARRLARPAENYTITGCTMKKGHGGVVIGSEMSGGVRRVAISNCVFEGTDRGIRLKSTRGRGGVVEDVSVSNVIMKDIRISALTLNLRYTDAPEEPLSERTPAFRHIHFAAIRGTAEQATLLEGLPEGPIEDVSFADIDLRCSTGMSLRHARDVRLRDVRVDTARGPALAAEGVSDLDLFAFETRAAHPNTPVVDLRRVDGAFVHGSVAAPDTFAFVRVGAGSRRVVVRGNHLAAAERAVLVEPGVPRGEVETNEKIHQG